MNLKYLAYNFIKTDYNKLFQYVNQLKKERGCSKLSIYKNLIYHLFKYDTLLLDYFYFRFFEDIDKSVYTNVWDMYKFQGKYNSSKHKMIFRDKCMFRERFDAFFNYPYFKLNSVKEIPSLIKWIGDHKMKKIVAKEPLGAVGKGVRVLNIVYTDNEIKIENENAHFFLKRIYKEGFILFEAFIEQHTTMNALNPKSVNTIRITTFINNDNLEIWGTLLRMGFDKDVDNFDAGGIGAKIDLKTGKVVTPGFVKDPFNKTKYVNHPISNSPILGLEIPYWDKIIEMLNECVRTIPEVKTVGWDFAITKDGPTLIEGNDNWDKTFQQLGTGIGLNKKIKYLINEEMKK